MVQKDFVNSEKPSDRVSLGNGLSIEVTSGGRPHATLYRRGVFVKRVDLTDKTARCIFVVETVELGAKKSRLAGVLGISRQTIHNYLETQRVFGREGLVFSYSPKVSRNRGKQRQLHGKELAKGGKAKQLAEFRKKESAARPKQLSIPPVLGSGGKEVPVEEQPFSEVHDWQASRYAGTFLYLIYLVSSYGWLDRVMGYFGRSYKIFMVFMLMVARNIGSIEQLKNIRKREAGLILGMKRIPSKPKLWQWFYRAARLKVAEDLLKDVFFYQLRAGLVGLWLWFVDGHLLPYTGKEKVHHAYNTQRRMPMPGRTNMVTCDESGRVVDFEIQEGKGDLRQYILALKNKWKEELPEDAIIVFDREGYDSAFFSELISNDVAFVTWDKHVDHDKLARLSDDLFTEELEFKGKKYNYFEQEKVFVKDTESIVLRHLHLWNRSSNRRTSGLAWTGAKEISAEDCVCAILNRWGASENTFKHLKDRHPLHYHPGFKLEDSEKQDIANPEIKEKEGILSRIRGTLSRLYKKLAKTKDSLNKDGSPRKNSIRKQLQARIDGLEAEQDQVATEKKQLPVRVDVSGLCDYKSFKQIDNEGKNLFDFVTGLVWNARKQMVDWLRPYFDQDNEVVDLFYAITECHGWIMSTRTEVRVLLEPMEQPKRRLAQEQLCRTLTALGARIPSGKRLLVEVGDSPSGKVSKNKAGG